MFLYVVKVYTSQQVSESRCYVPFRPWMKRKFEIWGWKENNPIYPHITKLSRVRVEGTYDCIHYR